MEIIIRRLPGAIPCDYVSTSHVIASTSWPRSCCALSFSRFYHHDGRPTTLRTASGIECIFSMGSPSNLGKMALNSHFLVAGLGNITHPRTRHR